MIGTGLTSGLWQVPTETTGAVELSWIEYVIIIGLILLNAFFAASEIAIVTVRKTRVRQLADEGNGSARAILRLTDNTSRFLATIQVGVTLTSFFASAFGAVSLVKLLESWFRSVPLDFIKNGASTIAFIIVTIVVAFLSLVFGELIPKTLAVESAEPVALRVARPIELISKISNPIVVGLTAITNFFVRLLGGRRKATMSSVSEEEIVSMVETGHEEGVVEKQESQIISRVFDFTDREVSNIMVPRPDMAMLSSTVTVAEAAREMVKTGYSRYPIYQGENREQISGIAYVKDVLQYLIDSSPDASIETLARPALFIPESKRLGTLLTELQKSRTQIAVVIDEYGGVAGMVTLEDCIEEIVGEIQDEYDREEAKIRPADAPDSYFINGATSLDEVNEALNIHLDDDKVDTVGGIVLRELGRMAVVGDVVTLKETRQVENPDDPNSDDVKTVDVLIHIEVEKLEGLRIRQVKLTIEG